jgi:hypothetical protein
MLDKSCAPNANNLKLKYFAHTKLFYPYGYVKFGSILAMRIHIT